MKKLRRRQFVVGAGGAVAAAGLLAAEARSGEPAALPKEPVPPATTAPTAPVAPGVIRVASVKTCVEGGLLPTLIDTFQHTSPYHVDLVTGVRVYDLAREGKIDLV